MSVRPRLSDPALRALKVATKALLLGCGGGEAASAACRLGPSHLSEAGSIHHPERLLPIDVVAQLEAASEDAPITRALARLSGHVLVPVQPRGPGDLPALLATLGREVGEVFATAAMALADGHVDEDERAALVRSLSEMLAAGNAALAALSPALPIQARPCARAAE